MNLTSEPQPKQSSRHHQNGVRGTAPLWVRCSTCNAQLLLQRGSPASALSADVAALILQQDDPPCRAAPYCRTCAQVAMFIQRDCRTVNLEVLRRANIAAACRVGEELKLHLAQLDVQERACRERHAWRLSKAEYALFDGETVHFRKADEQLVPSAQAVRVAAIYELLVHSYAKSVWEFGERVPF